jgi:hypothetical protein
LVKKARWLIVQLHLLEDKAIRTRTRPTSNECRYVFIAVADYLSIKQVPLLVVEKHLSIFPRPLENGECCPIHKANTSLEAFILHDR